MVGRPEACNGCPACPGSAGYDPKKTGPFVPPKGIAGPIRNPEELYWGDFLGVELVVVGMSPSFREVDEGEPFVFPNFFVLPQFGNALIYRSRPDGFDPDACIYDVWSVTAIVAFF